MVRMDRRTTLGRLAAAVLVASGSLVTILADDSQACASDHGRPFLGGFTGQFSAVSNFYAVPESAGQAQVTVQVTAGHCIDQPGSTATYQTENGTAVGGQDYTPTPGQTGLLCADVDGPEQAQNFCPPGSQFQQTVPVPITNDPDTPTGAVESFLFRLTAGQPFGLAEPASAPVHIVDVDGTSRVSLEPTLTGGSTTYQLPEFGTVAVPVFWAGGAPGSVAFSVQPDPAGPAQPGQDYRVLSPSPVAVPSGRVGFITIEIVGDKAVESPESLVVSIVPGPGYAPAPPTTATLTILDNEEGAAPTSRLHHPRHKWRYKKSDYRIREVHVFTHDNPGGAGVVGAQFALRRNLTGGSCAWLTKNGWRKQDCQNREWLPTVYDKVGELWRYRLKQLKSSVGTRIKNYSAFSRALDAAGNVESDFNAKRNANTFEVKRSGGKRR
jgi:hypothetical protein